MAASARYGGNPEHKLRPKDYGLTPPRNPRPGKAICDGDGEVPKADAERLLKMSFEKGMVSVQTRNGWPQNVWSVRNGEAFEAQLEDRERGSYHGYPMPRHDDFREVVLAEWARRG